MSTAKVGRPKSKGQHRETLICAARQLFIEQDYELVSIRAIAKVAGKDPALIRYYFGSKLNLFIAVIQETIAPVVQKVKELNKSADVRNPAVLMNTYYQVMAQYPSFPRLIYRLANMKLTPKNSDIFNIVDELIRPEDMQFFDQLKNNGLLKEGVDVKCAKLSFMSLVIFPFIIPELMKSKLDLEITPEFLTILAQQNMQLLSQGLMKSQEESND
ncbi:TetR/AcrR family transcriptional regulator [Flocculibacter collagenilyticus]|uniref:TetR/AcrR family transcriptional regulator n=1 Tax=Flocculibacter collagenilyticus TaxID=2744479 RepID=UPI0018F7AD82|nr:TetR/AcrR family transcriptional regulator [Flocculibacter collagenilyticus]